MRSAFMLVVVLLLMGCEATPVKNAGDIKSKVKLNSNLTLPVNLPVAYYVDKSKPGERKINFYGKLEEAAELVLTDMFGSASELKQGEPVAWFIELEAQSDWDFFWGGYKSQFGYKVKLPDGTVIFSRNIETKANGAGGFYDVHAVYNDFAKNIKELTTSFLNANTQKVVTALANKDSLPTADIAVLMPNLKHSSSGTGFFISQDGMLITAAHAIESCMKIEIHHKGDKYVPEVLAKSNLLDLAALKIDASPESFITVNEANKISLGKQLFVTGFPLSNILSDYPSLTVGNLTSLGGLKGAKGSFQFSAPIQPGNSGGAIVDYKGNLLGVVSATLNQSMMLQDSGTTSQNVNFGIDVKLLSAFLKQNEVGYQSVVNDFDFETASGEAVKYTTQVLCYE